jgi:ubiquinone/menaquinone biosynthesis C-methylase UbiE
MERDRPEHTRHRAERSTIPAGLRDYVVNPTPKPGLRTHYDSNYNNFRKEVYEDVRREAFGEDIGQNSWLTASELDRFLTWLPLSPGKRLLDVGCGAGGPALRLAVRTGCSVVGIDAHEQAIATANAVAADRGLTKTAEFRAIDATRPLPFPDGSFDVVTCIDAINHFQDRPSIVAEWQRVLKPSGRLLFTDPIVMTGPLTNAETAIRTSAGFYLLVPAGYDERVLSQCGFRLVTSENVTQNMADVAERRRAAREARETALREMEGEPAYVAQQEYLSVAARIAKEGRLSRFLFVAENIE